jgi:hypothetical protein
MFRVMSGLPSCFNLGSIQSRRRGRIANGGNLPGADL